MTGIARLNILAILFFTLSACGGASTDAPRMAMPVLTDTDGVAIQGYDPVSYFVAGAAQQGSPEYSAEWGGARWWFTSEANRSRFLGDPEQYAPAYGGWCAFGMAEGYAAETDPVNGWTIHEGRLYLNWDADVTSQWRATKESYLERSEPNWPEVKRQLQDGSATIYWHEQ